MILILTMQWWWWWQWWWLIWQNLHLKTIEMTKGRCWTLPLILTTKRHDCNADSETAITIEVDFSQQTVLVKMMLVMTMMMTLTLIESSYKTAKTKKRPCVRMWIRKGLDALWPLYESKMWHGPILRITSVVFDRLNEYLQAASVAWIRYKLGLFPAFEYSVMFHDLIFLYWQKSNQVGQ